MMLKEAFAVLSVLIELAILRHYLTLLLEPRESGWRLAATYTAAAILLSLSSIIDMVPYLRTMLYFVIVLLVTMLTCKGWIFWQILISACFTFFFAGIEICAYFLLLYWQIPNDLLLPCGVLLSKLASICTVRFLAGMMTKTYYYVQRVEQFALLIMPLESILAMYVLLELSIFAHSKTLLLISAVCSALLMAGTQTALYLFNSQLDRDELNKQVEIQRSALENKDAYEQKMRVIRQMGHDLKNIMTILAAYIKERQCDEALAYIKEKGVKLQENKMTYTNNELLNSLIADKLLLAQERKLDIKVINAVKDYAFGMDDLLLVLAEALDNAIENASPGSVVDVNMKQAGGYMQLSVKNCVEQEVVIDRGGRIPTSKADAARHGLGLDGIRAIVSKYQGDLQLISKSNQFTCLILVPYRLEV